MVAQAHDIYQHLVDELEVATSELILATMRGSEQDIVDADERLAEIDQLMVDAIHATEIEAAYSAQVN